ncbi:tyrosine-type recombinase/integrase, partial [Agrobacterium tumefaciens]|nr:tyrosine-type recombinase/integrase [Agrobacterium radiobacter]
VRASFEDIAGYIRPQLPDMPLSVASATLQLRISALRLWYDFLIYQDICSLNPLPRSGLPGASYTGHGLVPRITRLPIIPDDGHWLRFLKHVSAASLRDRLMLALAYYGALRRTELTALRLEDIDLAHRLVRIRAETTKNRRER